MDYKNGTVASFEIENNKLIINKLNDIYTGSKNLLIYSTGVISSDSSVSENPVPLYALPSATRGVIAGYYDEYGIRHTIELTKSDHYYTIPEAALAYDGALWISVYGVSGDMRQTSNVVKLYIDESNHIAVENSPEDSEDWREMVTSVIDSKLSDYSPILKNALSITKDATTITDSEVGTASTAQATTKFDGSKSASVEIPDRLPARWPLVVSYTGRDSSTHKLIYYGDEKTAVDLDSIISAMGYTKGGTLTITGNGATYTFNGGASTSVNLDTIIKTIEKSNPAGSTTGTLTLTGNSNTYSFNGGANVSVNLDTIIKAVIDTYDGDSKSY